MKNQKKKFINNDNFFFIYLIGDNMFIAHRGNDHHSFHENSLNALLDSLSRAYIDGVEFDVRLTKDNVIVLIHNMLIDFVSDGNGFVSTKTLRELKKYNFGTKEETEKITTLAEFLKQVHSSKIILIEIKEEKENYERWRKALKQLLRKYRKLNIYICSFNYELLIYLKKHIKHIPYGLIIGYMMNTKKNISNFEFLSYHYRSYEETNKSTMIWTINNKALYLSYHELADYIITDKAYSLI